MKSLREFLNENKVFFETIAALLLSIMAVVVSIAQMQVSANQNRLQNELMEMQNSISRQQTMPQFMLTTEQAVDKSSGVALNEYLYIDNLGGIARGVHVDSAVFFELTYLPESGLLLSERIAVLGYYGLTSVTEFSQGRLASLLEPENNITKSELRRAFQRLAGEANAVAYFTVDRYVRIGYQDTFGDRHVEYFYVPSIGSGSVLTQEEGDSVFEEYSLQRSSGRMIDLYQVTAQELIDLFE